MYHYKKRTVEKYIDELFQKGLKKPRFLSYEDAISLLDKIGIFRFKGYVYAFRNNLDDYSIDDVLQIYFFDKFLTRYTMELTYSIETLLKTRLIETSYKYTDNPFFYLVKDNYKDLDFISRQHFKNWKTLSSVPRTKEEYLHYSLYYRQHYNFDKNQEKYLLNANVIELKEKVNYPPFHYFVESATLGVIVELIKVLKIYKKDILKEIGQKFGAHNPKTFEPYLERLREVRNRAAHRERIFNRSYRSVKGIGDFKRLRLRGSEHRFADVYLFLFFMLGWLPKYKSHLDFYEKEIKVLFDEYQNDRLIGYESYMLNKQLSNRLRDFIARSVGKIGKSCT